MSDNGRVIAHQSQEKFQFYAVALVFTILGLSIQTANFDGYIAVRICELLSWLMLIISGLAGLSHLEWNPVIHMQMVQKDELEEKINQFVVQRDQGIQQVKVLQNKTVVPIEERITEFESYVEKLGNQITNLDKKSEFKYKIFKWSFGIGIVLLAASRSITPIIEIINGLG